MRNFEKREALSDFCEGRLCTNCKLSEAGLSCGRGKAFSMSYKGTDAYMTDDEIDAAYAIAFPGDTTAHIKDSGDRTEFSTGAVRDMREGKGRCDLMPLDVAAKLLTEQDGVSDSILHDIYMFQSTGDVSHLYYSLKTQTGMPGQRETTLLEVSKHYYAKPGDKILDTHLGSGSSRIAAYDAGLDFTGCEIDKEYFDAQEKRFEQHTAQMTLFV